MTMASKPSIKIINVPSDVGSMIKGKSLAPNAFAQAGLAARLQHIGFSVTTADALSRPRTWHVDGSFEPNGVRNEAENVQVCHQVKEAVNPQFAAPVSASTEPFLLVVGGECNIAPAIMSALWHRLAPQTVGMLYVDGDADLTVPGETGSSGNLASMTMTHLTMRSGSLESMTAFTRPDESRVCDSENTVLFGLNAGLQGNTRDQLAYLFDEGFRVFTSSAVALDPVERAKQALSWLEQRVDAIFILFDVDSIDGTTFPLANVPNRTGADFDKIMAAMKVFLSSPKVCGMVITEVNPDHDPGMKMIGKLINELVECFKQRL